MSSSQQTPLVQDLIDEMMNEAPDSPPETQPTPGGPSSSFSAPNGSQQNSHMANTSKSKSDDAAKVNHGAPGSSYSSKKFHDEYDRAVGSLLHRDWDHMQFPDPLKASTGR